MEITKINTVLLRSGEVIEVELTWDLPIHLYNGRKPAIQYDDIGLSDDMVDEVNRQIAANLEEWIEEAQAEEFNDEESSWDE